METTMTDLQKIAADASGWFEQATRDNGETYWRTKEGAPDFIRALCLQAHAEGRMLPDDWRYSFIVESLDALAENEDPEVIEFDTDPYNADLIDWLKSHSERAGYVDEAVEELGHSDQGIIGDISMGQYAEKREVLYSVRQFLEDRIEASHE